MSKASHMINLAPERHAQLRALAQSRGLSIAEQVERLISAEIERFQLDDQIPGYAVRRLSDVLVYFKVEDHFEFSLSPTKAEELAGLLEIVAGRVSNGGDVLNRTDGSKVIVARRGMAVTITFDTGDGDPSKRAMTNQIARDLARLLYKASRSE